MTSTQRKAVALLGVGNVGRAVESQLLTQSSVVVVAVSTSRSMLVDRSGASSARLEAEGTALSVERIVQTLEELGREGLVPVLVDCTASPSVPDCYCRCVQSGIRVVAANKNVFEWSWSEVEPLIRSPYFAYEATCGAGLPIISTLKSLIAAGDTVKSVAGLLSGTLAFVFSEVQKGAKFSTAVIQAKEKGYTEPDPRDDLSGKDVQRKLMVLARTIGLQIELDQVEVSSLVPESSQAMSVSEFLSIGLPALDSDFESQKLQAEKNAAVLRFVAEIKVEPPRAVVGVQAVAERSPLACAQGTDNLFLIVTQRYPRGLTIAGAGAGAEVTAMGVVSDILSLK